MKTKRLYFIGGLLIGIVGAFLAFKILNFFSINPDKKKDAILYAQNLIQEKFGTESKLMYTEGENPYYEGIEFPPVSKTKFQSSEYDTYIITFYANYHTERCVRYLKRDNSCINRNGDSFFVELEYKDGTWNEIESRRINN